MPANPGGSTGPGYEFDYAPFTTPVSISATTEAGANTIVSGNAVTYDGSTTILITCSSPQANPDDTQASPYMIFSLWDSSTNLGRLGQLEEKGSVNGRFPLFFQCRLTPSAGSHTYIWKAWNVAGTGSVDGGAGGASTSMPGFIRITKV
jgi:hypothetical protein